MKDRIYIAIGGMAVILPTALALVIVVAFTLTALTSCYLPNDTQPGGGQ